MIAFTRSLTLPWFKMSLPSHRGSENMGTLYLKRKFIDNILLLDDQTFAGAPGLLIHEGDQG